MSFIFRMEGGNTGLFVHIPRTGGQWIEEVFRHYRLKREKEVALVPGVRMQHAASWQVTEPFDYSFTIVRQPMSWYESWWRYQSQKKHWREYGFKGWHPQMPLNLAGKTGQSFQAFLEKCERHAPGYVTRMYEWYVGPPNWQHVSYVGHFETLLQDVATIVSLAGEEMVTADDLKAIAPKNAAESRPATCDRDLRKRIVASEWEAVRRFYDCTTPEGM